MIPEWLLAQLRCPITNESLSPLSTEDLQRLHSDCAAGKNKTKMGFSVSRVPTQGLVNASRTWVYPTEDGVLNLLADDAIAFSNSLNC